jgi:hypothetical protein
MHLSIALTFVVPASSGLVIFRFPGLFCCGQPSVQVLWPGGHAHCCGGRGVWIGAV